MQNTWDIMKWSNIILSGILEEGKKEGGGEEGGERRWRGGGEVMKEQRIWKIIVLPKIIKDRIIICKRSEEPNHINVDPDANTKVDTRKIAKKENFVMMEKS